MVLPSPAVQSGKLGLREGASRSMVKVTQRASKRVMCATPSRSPGESQTQRNLGSD